MASDQWQGVDVPQDSDHIYRLVVEKCFYVGGMGTSSEAEVIPAADYRSDLLTLCRMLCQRVAGQKNSASKVLCSS